MDNGNMEKNTESIENDYTHIAVILDRTGSMEEIRDDTIGGFNAFLGEQKAQEGKATLTLVQFDSQDPYEVIHRFKPIMEVPQLTRETYVPRATTPLLDALGRGINDLEKSLADMDKQDRPQKVVFAVLTDGQENASHEFRKDQIMKMINDKTEKEAWQFVFLSSDLAAIGDAQDMGFRSSRSMAFVKDETGTEEAWISFSRRTTEFRSGSKPDMAFGEEDRKHPQDSEKKKRERLEQESTRFKYVLVFLLCAAIALISYCSIY